MIHFYSTNNRQEKVSLEEAVMNGLAADGGLFMPEHIPVMPKSFFDGLGKMGFHEVALEVCRVLLQGALPPAKLQNIIESAYAFEAPLHQVSQGIFSLELFHGPTLSFKDFGACFMAQLMNYFAQQHRQEQHILVATSGDTGSAIAQAFLGIEGFKVWILYPRGKVSVNQEKQLTGMGQNIRAIEINGTFDDCQRLVKQAFNDCNLRSQLNLSSANSINIARLIPQMFYYFHAFAQLQRLGHHEELVFAVPCGNFGNLTAGLLAKKMGLPVSRFVAATNVNDSVPKYFQTGVFTPHASKHTLSNAMDVGNPSNFARMLDLYGNQRGRMCQDIVAQSFTDDETKAAMRGLLAHTSYVADPHGAVAYLGLQEYLCKERASLGNTPACGVFLETAHPAKFSDDVAAITGHQISIPARLAELLAKEKQAIPMEASYKDLHELLCENRR